jgi:hypothetical protein
MLRESIPRMRWPALLVLALVLVAAPAQAGSAATPDWKGSRHAEPSAYAWLNDYTPLDTYTIVVVRGMRQARVVKILGGAKRALPDETPTQADDYLVSHMNPDTYEAPHVVQVARRGHAVVVYAPEGTISDKAVDRLSRRGVATSFFTDIELDTYITVSKHGRRLRQFDAGFRPPKEGALPEERGLPWGRLRANLFATAWAFNERLTRTHLSEEWFNSPHRTFVAGGHAVS